jgi:hypothetical protein
VFTARYALSLYIRQHAFRLQRFNSLLNKYQEGQCSGGDVDFYVRGTCFKIGGCYQ